MIGYRILYDQSSDEWEKSVTIESMNGWVNLWNNYYMTMTFYEWNSSHPIDIFLEFYNNSVRVYGELIDKL